MSRAKTEQEVRKEFLDTIHALVNYWSRVPNETTKELCEGVAFSILNIFDGTNASLPAMNISLSPHPDDKEYYIEEGTNWYEPGMIINTDYLHTEFLRGE